MKVFRKNQAFLIEDKTNTLTPCSSLRETMYILHKVYSVPLVELETGLIDLICNEYEVAEFGDVKGEYLYAGNYVPEKKAV